MPRSTTVTRHFLKAVARRDYDSVVTYTGLPGFNPNALVHVPEVSWSTPERPAGAMAIAAANEDRRMISLLHTMGVSATPNRAGDDPLLILAASSEFASGSAMRMLLMGPDLPAAQRIFEAFNSVLMHCRPPQLAARKIALLCGINSAKSTGPAPAYQPMPLRHAMQISHLALQRYAGQPEFEPSVRLIAANWRLQYGKLERSAVRLALSSFPLNAERIGLFRQHSLK